MIWNSSIFWGIIGLIGGAVISSFFYFIGIKRKNLSCDINTICLISNKINQVKSIEVKYNSKEIENLFSSKVVIRNVGNTIIEEHDVAPLCPIAISTNGQFLVDRDNGMNLFPLNKANNVYPLFEVNEKTGACNRIIIHFDYISKKEEIVCSFFHTGDITIEGVIKEGKIYNSDEIVKRKRLMTKCFEIILCILVALISSYITTFLGGGVSR